MAGSAYYFHPPTHTCYSQQEGKHSTNLCVEVCISLCVPIDCMCVRVESAVCVFQESKWLKCSK